MENPWICFDETVKSGTIKFYQIFFLNIISVKKKTRVVSMKKIKSFVKKKDKKQKDISV